MNVFLDELTTKKASLTSDITLALFMIEKNIHKELLHNDSDMWNRMKAFARLAEEKGFMRPGSEVSLIYSDKASKRRKVKSIVQCSICHWVHVSLIKCYWRTGESIGSLTAVGT